MSTRKPFQFTKTKTIFPFLSITYSRPSPGARTLVCYSAIGREITTLSQTSSFPAGKRCMKWYWTFVRVMSPNGVPYWAGRRRKTLGREPITPGGIRIAVIAAHRIQREGSET